MAMPRIVPIPLSRGIHLAENACYTFYFPSFYPDAMPVYDYECASCGAFEAVRRIAERDDPAACPECGATAARVTIGAPSVGSSGPDASVADAGSYGMRHRGGCLCCG
jgi:putative FmdB family regulatory protein